MTRIINISGLEALRGEILEKRKKDRTILRTCISTGCRAQKSLRLVEALKTSIKEQGLEEKIEIKNTGCHGFCEMGTIMVIEAFMNTRIKLESVWADRTYSLTEEVSRITATH